MLKVTKNPSKQIHAQSNNKNRKRCEICSKLTIKTPEHNVTDVVLVPLLLSSHIIKYLTPFFSFSIVAFDQVNVC